MRVNSSSGRSDYFWTVTDLTAPNARVGLDGEQGDLEAAKAAFRRATGALRQWAEMKKGSELAWWVGAERAGR